MGSILEAPGLVFGGSGLDFPRVWTSDTMPEAFSLMAHTLPPTNVTFEAKKCPRSCRATGIRFLEMVAS